MKRIETIFHQFLNKAYIDFKFDKQTLKKIILSVFL